jgi:hypothetical protein
VGPDAGQFVKIPNLFQGMASYNTLGLVWFDKDLQGGVGPNRQDWRLEDSLEARIAFKLDAHEYLTPNPPKG